MRLDYTYVATCTVTSRVYKFMCIEVELACGVITVICGGPPHCWLTVNDVRTMFSVHGRIIGMFQVNAYS